MIIFLVAFFIRKAGIDSSAKDIPLLSPVSESFFNKNGSEILKQAGIEISGSLIEEENALVATLSSGTTVFFKKGEKIAVIGELANSKRDLLGSWKAAGDWNFIKSILDELKEYNGEKNVLYAEGCKKMGDDRTGFAQAMATARRADNIVMVIGEDAEWTGEAASRSNINIPGVQTELLEQLKTLKKPSVVVLMNGRPLVLAEENKLADAILEAWFPGTMGGKAVTHVLFGEYNPSGKLTMTFPLNLGQVPIFYYEKNTGRPIYLENDKYKSKYLDSPNDPLFPFGFGLSYTTFEYSNFKISKNTITPNDKITISADVKNTGCLLYTSPSPRDRTRSRMPSSA